MVKAEDPWEAAEPGELQEEADDLLARQRRAAEEFYALPVTGVDPKRYEELAGNLAMLAQQLDGIAVDGHALPTDWRLGLAEPVPRVSPWRRRRFRWRRWMARI